MVAFATPVLLQPGSFASSKFLPTRCTVRAPRSFARVAGRRATPLRMSAESSSASTATSAPVETYAPTEAPPGMNPEWYAACMRLLSAVKGSTFEEADSALEEADGDELEGLGLLTAAANSPLMQKRTAAANAAGANRVSAIKEAELRRVATGSARNYFKGFVEVKGDCVEQGIVDEDADAMKIVKGWFGLDAK